MDTLGKKIIGYTLNKLLFPKVVVVDTPGIIYNHVSRKFHHGQTRKRIIWFFEDIIVDLQEETIKQIGKEKAGDLWYRIGKDSTISYLAVSNSDKKVSSLFVGPVLEYILTVFRSAGFTSASQIEWNTKKEELVIEGKQNIFCRKSALGEYTAGSISGIVSTLLGKNAECRIECRHCPEKCRFVCSPHVEHRYLPAKDRLRPVDNYLALNFPADNKIENIRRGLVSFNELMRFKKITIAEDGKFYYANRTIIPSDIHGLDIVADAYKQAKMDSLFQKVVVKSSASICSEILQGASKYNAIAAARTIISGLGLGFMFVKEQPGKVTVEVAYLPVSKEFDFMACFCQGLLNVIYKTNMKLIRKTIDLSVPKIQLEFEKR